MFPYTVLGIILPFDFHIFQRGRYTSNQNVSVSIYVSMYLSIYIYIIYIYIIYI